MADQKLIDEVGKYIDKYYEPVKDDIKMDKEMLSIFDKITRFRKKRAEEKALQEQQIQESSQIEESAPEEFDVSTMQKTKIKKGMPSLSSFVEKGIRNNIQQISKFFKWMHHSGEFEKLDIDDRGIYAVRGLNNQEVRTYEMSTGQRSTIAMAVMFALHMAAPDAPQLEETNIEYIAENIMLQDCAKLQSLAYGYEFTN